MIGKGFGGATEKTMMQELVRNGAISVDIATNGIKEGGGTEVISTPGKEPLS